jgi:ATP-dependent helicase HrpB
MPPPRPALPTLPTLPILEALPALRAALVAAPAAVLEAPPGAGKSTVVPLALLDEPWVRGRKILMLEPRRLAARAVAQRMAETLGETVGMTVGHRMRLDTRVGPHTRIEVVTEGVLTRMLQSDPALEGVAAVLFDEFHERSLQADTGLALCLDARATLGTDLRIVVMSATLDGAAVSALLTRATGATAPVVTAAGRMYPVAVRYVGRAMPVLPGGDESPERLLALAVQRALHECEGDVLAFLPGAGEIRRALAMLEGMPEVKGSVVLLPLYGELPPAEQARVLAPDPGGRRRVVLATNIAETSLTLPGVRAVVDSGLVRRAAFDPVTGMSRLETRRISRAAADQRAGRAGRVAEGACYRLWSEGAQRSLAAQTPPEIVEADLAPLALDLAEWGADQAMTLPWLDVPPAPMLDSARDLLRRLGALDDARRITAHGRALARLPTHPRLAHLLLEAQRRGESRLGAQLAAVLGERDLLRGRPGEARDADVLARLDLVLGRGRGAGGLDPGAVARVRRNAELFERRLVDRRPAEGPTVDPRPSLGAAGLLACAYPDRIGRRRTGDAPRFLLANGRGAAFTHVDRLGRSEFIVALDLDDRDREARILLAAALDRATLEAAADGRLRREVEVAWSSQDEAVVAREVERIDGLVIAEKPLPRVPPEAALAAMQEGLRQLGVDALPWTDEARAFCARIELARRSALPGTGDWPDFSAAALAADHDWLEPWLEGITRRSHLARLPVMDALRLRLGAERCRRLDDWLPSHLTVPTGSRIRIDYLDDLAPCASMRMQEVFGMATTPRLADGRLPVTFKLLSPAQRPLQVTADLASFWRNAYVEVRKDMRGRYPRHYWPDDPLQAEPVRGIRRRT